MDREWGAQDALAFVRRTDFAPSAVAFDAAMQRSTSSLTGRQRRLGGRRHPGDRRRDARVRLHGQGALERVPKIAYMTWPPPLVPRLVAIAGRNEEAVSAAARAVRLRALDDRLARCRLRPGDRPVRQRRAEQRSTPSRPSPPPRPASTCLREAARPRRRRELRDLEGGRGDGREAPVRLQLPLRAGGAARAGDDRRRRARRDPPLPRPLPAGLGRRPVARHLALPPRRGRLGRARRPRRARRRPRALPGRRHRLGLGAGQDVPARPPGRRRDRGGRRVRERRGRHDRGDPPRARAPQRLPVGDQRLEGRRSRSTWSG